MELNWKSITERHLEKSQKHLEIKQPMGQRKISRGIRKYF